MNKLLCIVGPTGTGKTARAIEEASKTPSIIVSADSRQVYRSMDIVTGKDHPPGITIYGIDIVNPDQECSVAVWYDAVMPHINQAWAEGKKVIVVGGTGLYIRALTDGIATMQVPINQALRDKLRLLSTTELQEMLATLDSNKLANMNHSDQNNPRRLIRAIEICKDSASVGSIANLRTSDTQMIGLKYSDTSKYRSVIEMRVKERLNHGAVGETQKLLSKYSRVLQSMSAIGYRSVIQFLEGRLDEQALIDSWVREEIAYAKRQLTWFTKVKSIQWYDIDKG